MLPYADLENPLMWSVLVHELSHAFEATLGIVDEVAESFSAQSEKIIRRSKNWAREFCCDMIAIKLMGPSYLNAFLNLAFSINPWHHLHSDSHPQPYSRINYMSKYLDGSSERPSIHSSSSNHYTKVFRELYDKFSIQEETVQLAIRQEDLIQGLEQKISEITFPGEIGNGYLAITSNLTKKLKDGIPLISSYRSTPVEKITKKMEQFSNNQDAAPDDKIKELYDLLGLANEKPAKPADIVNAAWDYRAEKFWDLFKEIFTDSQLSYEEKFVKFAEHIDNFNYSIIKSLEISKIHQIFQPGEVK